MKKFFKSKEWEHIYSFLKTYFTAFLTVYLYGVEQQGKDPLDFTFMIVAAKFALISVLRTFYKLLTEK
jgi:hypothetical protein